MIALLNSYHMWQLSGPDNYFHNKCLKYSMHLLRLGDFINLCVYILINLKICVNEFISANFVDKSSRSSNSMYHILIDVG